MDGKVFSNRQQTVIHAQFITSKVQIFLSNKNLMQINIKIFEVMKVIIFIYLRPYSLQVKNT